MAPILLPETAQDRFSEQFLGTQTVLASYLSVLLHRVLFQELMKWSGDGATIPVTPYLLPKKAGDRRGEEPPRELDRSAGSARNVLFSYAARVCCIPS
jgi:hypothetical protein